jgi:hypothetical protein
MKKLAAGMGTAVVVFFLVFLFLGCASTGGGSASSDGKSANIVVGNGETLIIVQRPSSFVGAAIKHLVFIDGEQKLALGNGASGKIVVPNGEHTIYSMIDRPIKNKPLSERLSFTANGTELHFTAKAAMNNAVLIDLFNNPVGY